MTAQTVTIDPPRPHSKKQALIMGAFLIPGLREVYVAAGTKFGKALCLNTPIPTLGGWTTMGALKEGDFVFDETGKPTEVLFATDPMFDRKCFEVVFSDGHSIVADADHLWVTDTHSSRKNRARNPASGKNCQEARTTTEIAESLHFVGGSKKRPNHSVDLVSGAVEFPEKDLPIPPYTLGVWLGDGSSGCGQITNPDEEVFEHIKADGFGAVKGKGRDPYLWGTRGLSVLLKKYGIIQNKHVPAEYLTASPVQRLALLQGLMDTDGTVSKNGDCCFDNTNVNLADAVESLALSFGIKVKRSERRGKLNGSFYKMCYRVRFATDLPVFRVKRKLDRIRPVTAKSHRRYIMSVNEVPTVPVRCIRVASESHLFLCGRAFIPTHNTLAAASAQATIAVQSRQTKHRWVAPIYEQAKIGLEDYFPRLLPPAPLTEIRPGKMLIELPELETSIEFWHAKDPYSLEGKAINSYIIDEAAKCHPQTYVSARTTTTRTEGPMLICSTPLGKNWFYTQCMEAREHQEWALRNGRTPEKIFITARTTDNPTIKPEVIEAARREIPDRLFRQLYLAEFTDDGSVFAGTRQCLYGHDIEAYGDRQRWFLDGCDKRTVVIGVDWAKTLDYCVFISIDIETRQVCAFERFHKLPYTEAIRRLSTFAASFGAVEIIQHDKTGVGGAIDDAMSALPFAYRGVTFTNQSKSEMVARLITAVEQRQIALPRWPQLLSEMDSYEVKTTATGALTYAAAGGKHDDIVSALMLANSALLNYGDKTLEVFTLEDLGRVQRADEGDTLAGFYESLRGDDD